MKVNAVHIGQRIDVRALQSKVSLNFVSREPLVATLGKNKFVVFFRYGVVVFWNCRFIEIEKVLEKIDESVHKKFTKPEQEELCIHTGKFRDGISRTGINLIDLSPERVAIVSVVLSRSLVLDYFEKQVGMILGEIDEVTRSFAKRGRSIFSTRQLLKRVGLAMHIQHTAVSQMAMLDKPDLTWEDTTLDHFYNHLAEEYELEERYKIFTDKVDMLFRSVDFILSYLDARRSTYMELIIIFLILFEVVMSIYDKF